VVENTQPFGARTTRFDPLRWRRSPTRFACLRGAHIVSLRWIASRGIATRWPPKVRLKFWCVWCVL
jgi:hypothetical protein